MARVRRIFGLDQLPADVQPAVVTIGTFDGVHLGHRELIRAAVREASRQGIDCTAITFDPNPIEVIGQGAPPPRISTLRHRLELIEDLGVDMCLIVHFDEQFASMSAEDFVVDILVGRVSAERVVVGQNFHFGHYARGDVELLTRMGSGLGFEVQPQHLFALSPDGEPVSSTLIRERISEGDVVAATRCLARPHRVEGVVVPGASRGTGLGFPTANVSPTELAAIPGDGIYAGRLVVDPYGPDGCSMGGCGYPAAVSIGTNPTFGGTERRIEAFAYEERDLDLYSREVAIDFVARLRDQEAFATEADLVSAMDADVKRAREIVGG